MQGDTLHGLHGLTDWRKRVQNLNRSAARLQAVRDQLSNDLEVRHREVEGLAVRVERLTKVGELLRALMDKLVHSQVRSVETLITGGLRSIFFDQQLTFEAEIVQRYNRVHIDFFIRQERGGGRFVVRGRPLTNFGGGPATVASLVLRVLVLMKLQRTPLLLLDETLSAISTEYIDQTGLFLKKLAASTGTPILLVTHKHEFLDQATAAYSASEHAVDGRPPRLDVHRLRGAAT